MIEMGMREMKGLEQFRRSEAYTSKTSQQQSFTRFKARAMKWSLAWTKSLTLNISLRTTGGWVLINKADGMVFLKFTPTVSYNPASRVEDPKLNNFNYPIGTPLWPNNTVYKREQFLIPNHMKMKFEMRTYTTQKGLQLPTKGSIKPLTYVLYTRFPRHFWPQKLTIPD